MVTTSNSRNSTATEIMHAACRVLAQEGYADLTTQKIANECERSQGIIHYHYNSKEDIFIAVIDHLIDERATELEELPTENASVRLNAFLELFLPSIPNNESQVHAAVSIAVHAQAPYHTAYRKRLNKRNKLLQETLTDIIEEGIEQDLFYKKNPEKTAISFLSMIDGAIFREVALDDDTITDTIREMINSSIHKTEHIDQSVVQ